MSARVAGQRFWFLDTASLLSMAVDDAIATAVLAEIDDDTVVVIDVVVSELEHRATIAGTAALAKAALASRLPSWVELRQPGCLGDGQLDGGDAGWARLSGAVGRGPVTEGCAGRHR